MKLELMFKAVGNKVWHFSVATSGWIYAFTDWHIIQV